MYLPSITEAETSAIFEKQAALQEMAQQSVDQLAEFKNYSGNSVQDLLDKASSLTLQNSQDKMPDNLVHVLEKRVKGGLHSQKKAFTQGKIILIQWYCLSKERWLGKFLYL